mgnify:FL=1
MFGLNGRSFFSNIFGHLRIHFSRKKFHELKGLDLNRTIEIVKNSNAHVIGVCEILEGQEKELKKRLGEIRYKYVFFW